MALPVNHTSNQWKKDQYGNYERSNRVYKMTYRFYDRTHYDRTKQETVTDAWYLSWHLHYNTICNPTPDLTGDGWQLAGQSDKRFTEKADMERYLQGRIKAYAHLFTEVSPPIPKGQEGRFSVNGVLLPGYTVEASLEERVEEMLSFLEDDPALLEEPLSSGHQDTPQEEEPTMAQKLHTTPLNQHRNRESVQKPETARKGPKKPPGGKRPRYGDSGARAAVRASMAFDSKMPLVRGSAPDTPHAARKSPQFEGTFSGGTAPIPRTTPTHIHLICAI